MVNNSTNVNKVNKSPLTYSLNLKKIIIQGQHREIYPINTINVESFPLSWLQCSIKSYVLWAETNLFTSGTTRTFLKFAVKFAYKKLLDRLNIRLNGKKIFWINLLI